MPNSRGCGEQWVRERYASAVGAYRHRAKRAETRLIVVIDADIHSLEYRRQQLAKTLSEERQGDEKIVHLIPKRSIETWVLCLTGSRVDESTDYSRENIDERIEPAANTFFKWTRQNAAVPQECVDSLRAAIPEISRLHP
ncbi:MAG TPA: hypothetical protein VKG25_23100 [Bryobacteraceae bacterium]|nr:hypothetical protein [Bryobacteraceae bacterium]